MSGQYLVPGGAWLDDTGIPGQALVPGGQWQALEGGVVDTSLTETASATDTPSVASYVPLRVITEAASAADTVSLAGIFWTASITEAASATDEVRVGLVAEILELAYATDTVTGTGGVLEWTASITEPLSATDLLGSYYSEPVFPDRTCAGVYPSDLPGLGWSVVRTATFQTRVQRAVSGKEFRTLDYPWPLRRWSLTYELLRDFGEYTELRTLMGFFGKMKGAGRCFCFVDPEDSEATAQLIGTGDGTTTEFQLGRWLGGLFEPLEAISDLDAVYFNGADAALSGGSWTFDDTTGLITFATPPGQDVAITVDLAWYWRVRFVDDSMPFEQFFKNFWNAKRVDLIQCRD